MVLDTCAVLWWTTAPDKISKKTLESISKSKNIYMSAISVAEIGIKVLKKKLSLPITITAFVNRLKLIKQLQIVPVDETVCLKALTLKWNHPDPADRFIVATAKILDCPIVTTNKEIKQFYKNVMS